MDKVYFDWNSNEMLEVLLPHPDNFLVIKETLTRIGIASRRDNTLYQSCHILHKQGKYFITHFKELFALDGKPSDITLDDIERRNTIAGLLSEWKLLTIVDEKKAEPRGSLSHIKIVSHEEKDDWNLVAKYSIGKKK